MTKSEQSGLEDLCTWGVHLSRDFALEFGEKTMQRLLIDGYIQVLESPVGEVLALAPPGYRHFDYAYQWYKPKPDAMMDQLALRLVVQMMRGRGYNQASWITRTVARVVSAQGVPTYLVVKYRNPKAGALTGTVQRLLERGIEENAEIILFREDSHRIRGALSRSHHRVTTEEPPWILLKW